MFIEPADDGQMGFLKTPRNPYDRLGFQPGKIGEDLTQVGMIGVLQLIFYQYMSPIGGITGEYISGKLLDSHFSIHQLQWNADYLRKPSQVIRQPRCEILSLVRPCAA